ncbi:Ribonuclease H domain [Trinorchestia longiramus]|nr:Ribonuclease H domain [Trinorchestia longiramus]
MKVCPCLPDSTPTWRIPIDTFCSGCRLPKKQTVPANIMRGLFLEHVADQHAASVKIYTDGSKSGGAVGYSVVLGEVVRAGRLLSVTSVFTAELYGVIEALQLIEEHPNHRITVFTDSKSIIDAIQVHASSHPIIGEINDILMQLLCSSKHVRICWVPGQVGVSGNERADLEAKRAATSEGETLNECVPCHDYYPLVKAVISTLSGLIFNANRMTNILSGGVAAGGTASAATSGGSAAPPPPPPPTSSASDSSPQTGGGSFPDMTALLSAGRQLAEQMQSQHPDLLSQLRSQMGDGQPPNQQHPPQS